MPGVIKESGNQELTIGAIADGQFLKRDGTTITSAVAITSAGVTYENLNANSDVGTGADQVAVGNHTHTTDAEDVMGGALQYVSTTSIKWGFLNNNQVTIHNGTSFRTVKLAAEPTLDHEANTMAGVAQDHDIVYDVFLLDDSDTAVSIICAKWAVSTEGASARTAEWDGVAGHYVVGDRVSHNSKYWACILANDHAAAKDPDTEPNYWLDLGALKDIDSLVGTGLYQEDGVLVYGPLATGDTAFDGRKYRWVGVIRLYDDSGAKFKNLINYRSIGNYYNSVETKVQTSNSTASWTYNTATMREFRAGTNQTRGHFVSAVTQYCQGGITGCPTVSSGGAFYIGLGIDSTTTINTNVTWSVTAATESCVGAGSESIGYGAHYITELEYGPGTGTGTNYANDLTYFTGWLLPRL